jgi:hypothetical protein
MNTTTQNSFNATQNTCFVRKLTYFRVGSFLIQNQKPIFIAAKLSKLKSDSFNN